MPDPASLVYFESLMLNHLGGAFFGDARLLNGAERVKLARLRLKYLAIRDRSVIDSPLDGGRLAVAAGFFPP